jgi:exodeoxyribonuclease VII small subunit
MADDATPSAQPGPEPTGYAEAMAELEAILAEIEDDAVDVDVLTRKVARAAQLVRWCRGRIDGARVDVERIVADLTPDAPADDQP